MHHRHHSYNAIARHDRIAVKYERGRGSATVYHDCRIPALYVQHHNPNYAAPAHGIIPEICDLDAVAFNRTRRQPAAFETVQLLRLVRPLGGAITRQREEGRSKEQPRPLRVPHATAVSQDASSCRRPEQ